MYWHTKPAYYINWNYTQIVKNDHLHPFLFSKVHVTFLFSEFKASLISALQTAIRDRHTSNMNVFIALISAALCEWDIVFNLIAGSVIDVSEPLFTESVSIKMRWHTTIFHLFSWRTSLASVDIFTLTFEPYRLQCQDTSSRTVCTYYRLYQKEMANWGLD